MCHRRRHFGAESRVVCRGRVSGVGYSKPFRFREQCVPSVLTVLSAICPRAAARARHPARPRPPRRPSPAHLFDPACLPECKFAPGRDARGAKEAEAIFLFVEPSLDINKGSGVECAKGEGGEEIAFGKVREYDAGGHGHISQAGIYRTGRPRFVG